MKMRHLLVVDEHWVKHQTAADAQGQFTFVDSTDARAWCLYGAVQKCYGTQDHDRVINELNTAISVLYPHFMSRSIVNFNDRPETSFEDIRKVLELADV